MSKPCCVAFVFLAVICLQLSFEADARTTVDKTNAFKRDVQPSKDALVSALESDCVPLLIQRAVGTSWPFNRSWSEFKAGFEDASGNYWLGNELLSRLTADGGRYKLRFDVQSRSNGNWYHAEYSTFRVSPETDNYRLTTGGFEGNTRSDAFGYQNGMQFSTVDRDNDQMVTAHCATLRGGGFWYRDCAYCSVNGDCGYFCDDFYWYGLPGGRELRASNMWLLCK